MEKDKKEGAKRKVIVSCLEKDKPATIIAHDGSTGLNTECRDGVAVELTEHQIESLKAARYPRPEKITDEKTGQERTDLVMAKRFSIEEA